MKILPKNHVGNVKQSRAFVQRIHSVYFQKKCWKNRDRIRKRKKNDACQIYDTRRDAVLARRSEKSRL